MKAQLSELNTPPFMAFHSTWSLWKIFILLFIATFAFRAEGHSKQQDDSKGNPNATEVCNGKDDDGDGLVDENCTGQTIEVPSLAKSQIEHESDLGVMVAPNPSVGEFRVTLAGINTKDIINLRVFDSSGRLVEARSNLLIGQTITIGSKFIQQGMYIIEATQGTRRKTAKIIKQ